VTPPPVQIVGFTSTDFVPGFVGETVLGAGTLTAANIPNRLLVVGLMDDAVGTATPDADVDQIFNEDEAKTLYGPGTELARMCQAALRVPGIQLFAAATAEGAGTAATCTATITGTATAAGEFRYRINGVLINDGIASGDTPTNIGDTIAARCNALTDLPVTAVNVTGVVTFTTKNDGLRFNDYIIMDEAPIPATSVTSVVAGGAAVNGPGVRFTGGTVDDATTTLEAVIFGTWYQRVAVAHRDATNLAAWEAHFDSTAGPLEGRPASWTAATNAAIPTSLAQTTLNAYRAQLMWMFEGETDPAEMAAYFAALRAVTEQGDPDAAYDGTELVGVAPHATEAQAAIPGRSTLVTALQSGITPVTTENGVAVVVRSITTHSLDGTNPDFRTLDTSQVVVPDFVRTSLGLIWTTEFLPANPRVQDDPDEGEATPAAGVAYPQLWNQRILQFLKDMEDGSAVSSGLPQLIEVDDNPPASGFDAVAKRIMSSVPTIPAPNQHQAGVSVRQVG
jgi:phage tail sheath gpL-like